ncbi:hypothetical protein AB5I39_08245 [Sphingomonas sp. MMS24-J45]|uniref:hypothetical protein n=1 Tax=Sphingomonas sp. MMS24-J45 TaxID=3238806 RepID=UPI00384D3343
MKAFFAVVVGIAVAFFLVSSTDWLCGALFPIDTVDAADPVALTTYVGVIPIAAKLLIASGWLIAPFAGAWLALRIADGSPGGWIVVGAFIASNLVNQFAVPHPLWMQVAAVMLPLIAGWLARRLHRKPFPGEPLLG